jgi:16S rRNA C1402 (ribose-2'-O) methylase RsmI
MYPIIQTVSAQELNKVSEESIEDSPSQKEETMLLNDNNSEISEVVDTQNEENELEQSNKDQQDVDNSQEESDEAIDDEVIS